MLFPCGWPKAYRAFPPSDEEDEIIAIVSRPNGLLLASRRGIQIWSSGQNPVKLGQGVLSPEDLEEVGVQVAVVWNPALGSVVSLTEGGWLLFFLLQESSQAVLPPGVGSGGRGKLKIFQIFPAVCVKLFGNGLGSCLITDGSMVLVGMQDGGLQGYLWRELLNSVPQGSTFEWGDETPSWYCGSVDPVTLEMSSISTEEEEEGEDVHEKAHSFVSIPTPPTHGGVIDMDYSARVQSLVLTFNDGSVALCMTAEWGLAPLDEVMLRQWVCRGTNGGEDPDLLGTCARVGDAANLVAVGCRDGSVAMFRLSSFTRLASVGPTPACTAPIPSLPPLRKIRLGDWGHSSDVTGAVRDIQWNQDCTAFAVGYGRQGIAVWTPSGCRLMCSLPQTPSRTLSTRSSRAHAGPFGAPPTTAKVPPVDKDVPPLQWGISALGWGSHHYRLWMSQAGVARELWELKFVQAPIQSHRVARSQEEPSQAPFHGLEEVYVLQGDDRVLLVSEGMDAPLPSSNGGLGRTDSFDPFLRGELEGDLVVRHILVPQHYILENWPIQLVSMSPDGGDIAVAGQQGMAMFSRRSERWRLFGDVGQEKAVQVLSLSWLHKIVVVCSDTAASRGSSYAVSSKLEPECELLLFPRYHLDFGSLLARYSLKDKPVALDCLDKYILVASRPLDVLVLEVAIEGELELSGNPKAILTPVRELSIMSMEHPILNVTLVRAPAEEDGGKICEPKTPEKCVVLRWGGVTTILDLEEGKETLLTNDVECFWLSDPARLESHKSATTSGASAEPDSPDSPQGRGFNRQMSNPSSRDSDTVEMPWWAYGSRGMELWFPSSLFEPLSPKRLQSLDNLAYGALDPELEFDREVYPIGISLADASIIGVTQRLVRSPPTNGHSDGSSLVSSLPCFYPIPESQPVLPCLLRRLLQRGAFREARLLAQKHQELGLHFSRSLEWLLFTSLEFEGAQRSKHKKGHHATSSSSNDQKLLKNAASLVRSFPQYPDVVVSVARKTDAQYWPLLFDAVGRPSKLLDRLLRQGALHGAACLLIVIEQLEGQVLARALSMQLLGAALSSGHYDLVAELIRHLISPTEFDLIFLVDSEKTAEENQQQSRGAKSDIEASRGSIGSWFMSWLWTPPKQDDETEREPEREEISGQCREATQMVREHVRRLLDVGKLEPISQFGRALAPLGGGLPALMSTSENGMENGVVASAEEELTTEDLLAALSTAMSELSYPVTSKSLFDVEVVLETSQQTRHTAWAVALALMLKDMPVLVGFRIHHPNLWARFVQELKSNERFAEFVGVAEEAHSSA
ncbi:hypothetical protein BSKO_06419 [Bryopsis sp. KO-2023]|nr:hypothetical protein BSKO_06419 [Bryopsis sp. KO-2023]